MPENMVYKTFRAEIKEVDAQAGIINMVIPMSTGAVDRDNEIILPSAFKASLKTFMNRPILLSSHNYSDLRKQIGEFRKLRIDEGGLLADGLQFYIGQGNDEADWGFYLASKGMAAFSVGFIPQKTEPIDDKEPEGYGNRRFIEVELLEISQVVVPSNRDAIQGVRSKALNDPVTTALLDDIEKGLVDGTVTKPEETDDYIRIPVKGEAGKHDDHRIRTIDIDKDKGIKALYCVDCKKIITYLFAKDHDWTMASAQEWVDEHEKSFQELVDFGWSVTDEINAEIEAETPTANAISQEQLRDDIDFLQKAIVEVGMSAETEISALDMANEIIKRITGADIPDDILTKVGTVLDQKVKDNLTEIWQLAQEVLDSAKEPHEEEGDEHVETPNDPDPAEVIHQRATDVAEVAELVIARLRGKRIQGKRIPK